MAKARKTAGHPVRAGRDRRTGAQRVAALFADWSRCPAFASLALLGVGVILGLAGWSAGTALDVGRDLRAGIEVLRRACARP